MPASIFAGSKVKTLKSTLSLNGGADVISSTVDPTAVAVDASPGSLLLNTTTGKQYRKNDSGSSTNWTEVGAGTSGINYITNPSAATNTTGWATYADAAGAAPVDGTGGSPTVTWTRSTTTPLRGAADFNFTTPGGGSVQGQGVSTDFTIDLADQAKVLTVTFDYEVLSGTYASGDLTCYLIADPTGTPVVIQPAGYVVQAATVGTKMRQIATFQTQATGQSYRLCLHVASTSAAAYSLAVDSVSVGPQVVQYGAPVTDKQNYTLNITSASGTNPTFGTQVINQATWRRVGDCMEIQFQYRQSSTGTAGNGIYLFSLPAGYQIDSTKLNLTGSTTPFLSTTIVGTGSVAGSGNQFTGYVAAYDATRLFIAAGNDTQNPTFFSNTTTQNFGTGPAFYMSFIAMVPILGWSSTVQMSNDTDTRVVAAKALSTGTQAIAGSVGTLVSLGSVSFDTHGKFSTTSSLYTIPVPGIYRVIGKVGFSVNQSAVTIVAVQIDGATADTLQGANQTTAGEQFRLSGSTLLSLKAGQTVGLIAFSSAATTINSIDSASLQIEMLSGPSAIAASETVAAFATQSSGPTIPTSTLTTIVFNNNIEDTHGSYNKLTGIFKVPVSGRYFCASALSFTTAVADTNTWAIEIQKNGVLFSKQESNKQTTGFSARMNLNTAGIVSAVAGDEIRVQGYQDTGSGRGLFANGAQNTLSIFRIGN